MQLTRFLFQNGADPNLTDSLGRKPLLMAVKAKSASIVEVLLENGADLSIRNTDGISPETLAELMEHTEILKIWVDHKTSKLK